MDFIVQNKHWNRILLLNENWTYINLLLYDFSSHQDTCTQAYLSLRSHSRLLVTLFSLMLLTGIPELSAAEDIRYLQEALQEEQNEVEATEHFLQQISVCEQKGWTVQANWWFHMVAGIKWARVDFFFFCTIQCQEPILH